MRRLLPLALVLLAAPAVAQPLPTGIEAAPRGRIPGGTHFFAELLGASPFFSFNLEREVLPYAVVRGGLGLSPDVFDGGSPVTGVAGASIVPGNGTFRPEVGASMTLLSDDGLVAVPAGYLGLRVHTGDRSLLRAGVSLLYFAPGGYFLDGVIPWPSLAFGGRL